MMLPLCEVDLDRMNQPTPFRIRFQDANLYFILKMNAKQQQVKHAMEAPSFVKLDGIDQVMHVTNSDGFEVARVHVRLDHPSFTMFRYFPEHEDWIEAEGIATLKVIKTEDLRAKVIINTGKEE